MDVWIRTDDRDIMTAALEAGIGNIITSSDTSIGRFGNVLRNEDITSIHIEKPSDVDSVYDMLDHIGFIVLSFSDWKIIPMENIISRRVGTKILAVVRDPEEAALYSGIMEKGADGIVIDNDDIGMMKRIVETLETRVAMELSEVTVTDVRNLGMGDRVCVDSCTIMHPGEGMLIGSSSSCLFLVQSESEECGYAEVRPFRVNAGSVHSYILVGDETRYLSELRCGDGLLIVDSDGNTKNANVGRCKIERRPMILVDAEYDGNVFSVILQNAETVRLVTTDGSVPVTSIRPGDKVMAHIGDGGRHFGVRVDETVVER